MNELIQQLKSRVGSTTIKRSRQYKPCWNSSNNGSPGRLPANWIRQSQVEG